MSWSTTRRSQREEIQESPVLTVEQIMARLNRFPQSVRSAVMTRAAKLPSVNTHQLTTMIRQAQVN